METSMKGFFNRLLRIDLTGKKATYEAAVSDFKNFLEIFLVPIKFGSYWHTLAHIGAVI